MKRRIHNHQNKVNRKGRPDRGSLPGVLVRKEGDEAIQEQGFANALYDTADDVIKFFRSAFQHEIIFQGSELKLSYHYGKEFMGGIWVPRGSCVGIAAFGDGDGLIWGPGALSPCV